MNIIEKGINKATKELCMIKAVIPCENCRQETKTKEHLVVYHAKPEFINDQKGIVPVDKAYRSIFCSDRCLRKYLKYFKLPIRND